MDTSAAEEWWPLRDPIRPGTPEGLVDRGEERRGSRDGPRSWAGCL